MYIKMRRLASRTTPFLGGFIAILLAAAIAASPESSFAASMQGLKLWWSLVFPALLPFLILSQMLTASGFVHGFGVLLEPLMNRVFRLPGAGGWTLALGATAGFPGGAQGAAQLHKQGHFTGIEAGRLASLVHLTSPVTLLIVIGSALFHQPATGYSLLALHWLSGLLAGLLAPRLGRWPKQPQNAEVDRQRSGSLFKRMVRAGAEARRQDGRSFGKLLGESVSSSVQNLMIVGGYIIMFSVVIRTITDFFPQLSAALTSALLELHLGAQAVTDLTREAAASELIPASHSGLVGFALLSAALGWSGICAHLQVLTLMKPAGLRYLPFAAIRLLHAGCAFILTLLLWRPLLSLQERALPALAASDVLPIQVLQPYTIWNLVPQLLGLHILMLVLLLMLSGIVYGFTKLRHRYD